MLFDSRKDRDVAIALSQLTYCNPFLPEWVENERKALGRDCEKTEPVWSVGPDEKDDRTNLSAMKELGDPLAERLRDKLASGSDASDDDVEVYRDMVFFLLYARYIPHFAQFMTDAHTQTGSAQKIAFYRDFARDMRHFLLLPERNLIDESEISHLFACYFQIRRAFHHIYFYIVGRSMETARLRANVWQSIFTHDMRRYRRILYKRMAEISTLITGPSGTGKELVARAIGLSRYLPFDEQSQRFSEDFAVSFMAVNIAALSPTLIESELFGHKRGAFTGATDDRAGWLESCTPAGTVFLDEIGDMHLSLQVKLLRALDTRSFQRIGETMSRTLEGKVIAATNRDLPAEIAAGGFREDLYYRLCADVIRTPTLQEQLQGSGEELRNMIAFMIRGIAGEDEEKDLAREVEKWVVSHLGLDYLWPGNFRELQQCIRNIMLRKEYIPGQAPPANARDSLMREIFDANLSAEELLSRYCALVYEKCGSYEGAARILGLDRRTVKAKIRQGTSSLY